MLVYSNMYVEEEQQNPIRDIKDTSTIGELAFCSNAPWALLESQEALITKSNVVALMDGKPFDGDKELYVGPTLCLGR